MNRMDGKICVVTGATQGLGAAIARRLATAGAKGIVAPSATLTSSPPRWNVSPSLAKAFSA